MPATDPRARRAIRRCQLKVGQREIGRERRGAGQREGKGRGLALTVTPFTVQPAKIQGALLFGAAFTVTLAPDG